VYGDDYMGSDCIDPLNPLCTANVDTEGGSAEPIKPKQIRFVNRMIILNCILMWN